MVQLLAPLPWQCFRFAILSNYQQNNEGLEVSGHIKPSLVGGLQVKN
jgi:hypothetical protein